MPVIKYKGVFEYDKLFKTVRDWLIHHDFEITEGKFKHGVPNANGQKHEVLWLAFRDVTAYIRYEITIDYRIWDLKDVDVMDNGRKKRMAHAKIKIDLNYKINEDYRKIFKGSKFIENLGIFFKKYVYKQDIYVVHTDTLFYWMYNLHKVIKDFLNMESKYNAY